MGRNEWRENSVALEVICGDCLTEMRKMEAASIDLVVTSPPYNLRNSTRGKSAKSKKWKNSELISSGYDSGSDCMPHDEYVAWQREFLFAAMRLIPETGAIFYNHKWRVQKGLMQDRADILNGFPVRQIIIWKRKGGFNFNPGYFLPTYEVIYMIAKPKFRLLQKSLGLGDVWEIPQERDNAHPAPFPVALPERIIGSCDAKVVLDPFCGSGSTGVACAKLGRSFIGIDISEKYCEQARRRIACGTT